MLRTACRCAHWIGSRAFDLWCQQTYIFDLTGKNILPSIVCVDCECVVFNCCRGMRHRVNCLSTLFRAAVIPAKAKVKSIKRSTYSINRWPDLPVSSVRVRQASSMLSGEKRKRTESQRAKGKTVKKCCSTALIWLMAITCNYRQCWSNRQMATEWHELHRSSLGTPFGHFSIVITL